MYTSVSARAAASYRQASATGASPHQIVSLLFDALSQALHAAMDGIDRNDAEAKGRNIGRAVRLLDEGLKAGLNDSEGGELAANLRALYEYSIRRLTLANLNSDRKILAEVSDLLAPVALAWRQMDFAAPVAARTAELGATMPAAIQSAGPSDALFAAPATKAHRSVSFYSA
ncbi:MAG: flagellar export chaperone FliS [Giesbergeria sp.]